jgi:hypothetical protein
MAARDTFFLAHNRQWNRVVPSSSWGYGWGVVASDARMRDRPRKWLERARPIVAGSQGEVRYVRGSCHEVGPFPEIGLVS